MHRHLFNTQVVGAAIAAIAAVAVIDTERECLGNSRNLGSVSDSKAGDSSFSTNPNVVQDPASVLLPTSASCLRVECRYFRGLNNYLYYCGGSLL